MRFVRLIIAIISLAACGLWPASAVAVAPVSISITTHLGDQQSFVQGDRISFLLSLDRDAFVYLFYRDAERKLLQLLPNHHLDNHAFLQGLFMPLPSAQQPFQFMVQAPYGDEQVFAFASNRGDLHFAGRQLDNGLMLVEFPIETIAAKIRQASSDYFGEFVLGITTLPAVAQ